MIVSCAICSDLLNPSDNLYVTKCGHLFHFDCLQIWIMRAKSCPQCRNKVTEQCMFRFYPTTTDSLAPGEEKALKLQVKLDHTMLKYNQQMAELKTYQEKAEKANSALEISKNTVKSLQQKIIIRDSALCDSQKEVGLYQEKVKALEGALCESESERSELLDRLQEANQDLAEEKSKYNKVNVEHHECLTAIVQLLECYSEDSNE